MIRSQLVNVSYPTFITRLVVHLRFLPPQSYHRSHRVTMLSIPVGDENFTVWLEDIETGVSLKEHEVQTLGNFTRCYVPSEIGQRFRVCIDIQNCCACYAADLYFDGQLLSGTYIGQCSGLLRTSIGIDCFDYGGGKSVPLKFGQTRITPCSTPC